MRVYVLSFFALLQCFAVVAAQQPRGGTFRAATNFVEVHAVVTDDNGHFVTGLTTDDFEIYEDGKSHVPAVLSLVDIPKETPAAPIEGMRSIEPDVRAAMPSFEGRIYVIVLDELHTPFIRSTVVRDVARAFVEKYLAPNDLAAVVYTSGRRDAGQELTNSRRLLLASIDRFEGRKLPAAGAEKLAVHLRQEDVAAQSSESQIRTVEGRQRSQSVRDPYDAERALNTRRALRSIKDAASWLEDVPGRRKALLFFSEGFDADIYEPFNRGVADALLLDVREAVAAAQRANVTVYGIDPRGLNNFTGLADIKGYSDYPQLEYGTFRGFLRELLLTQESLISLSQQTGGIAIVNSGDVVGGLGRIVLDSSRYYLLGYYSDAQESSDKFRKIDVKVKRPGLQVRARRGYVPAGRKAAAKTAGGDGAASTALAAALSKPLPIGTLPLRVSAVPFKGTGKNASVLVALEVGGSALTFEEQEGRWTNTLEVSIVATDQHAKVQGGDQQTLKLQLQADTRQLVNRGGVRFFSRLEVPPGRYQIRVGAHETRGGASVMVPFDLEVPDYAKAGFAVSGVVLTSSSAESIATANSDAPLASVLTTPPVVSRTFSTSDTLTSYVEVYDASGAAGASSVTVTVRAASDGRTVFSSIDRGANASRATVRGVSTSIPLKDLASGMYLMRIDAVSSRHLQASTYEVPLEVVSAR